MKILSVQVQNLKSIPSDHDPLTFINQDGSPVSTQKWTPSVRQDF